MEEEGETYHRNNERPRRPVQRLHRSTSPVDETLASGFATELADGCDGVVRGGGDCQVGLVGYAVLGQEMVQVEVCGAEGAEEGIAKHTSETGECFGHV